MAFYHQHTGSSCKFSLNTNAMIQAKRWMGRVSAVIWTRDTSTRNLLDSAHTSHCSSRLLFISHFRWINSCRLIYTSMYSNYKLYMCIYIFSWIFGYVSNLGPSHGLSSSQFLPMATFPHLSDGEMHHLAVITDCQLSSVVESLLHQGPRRPRAGTRTAREFMAVFGEKSTINGCFYGKIHYNWRFWWENHQNGGLNDPSEFWRAFAMRDLPSKGKAPKWDNWLGNPSAPKSGSKEILFTTLAWFKIRVMLQKKQTEMLMMPPQGISIYIYIVPFPYLNFAFKKNRCTSNTFYQGT